MTMSSKMVLVGMEEKENEEKGTSYVMLAFVQGADTAKFMCKDEAVLKLPVFKEYEISFGYNTKYEKLSILSMRGIQ